MSPIDIVNGIRALTQTKLIPAVPKRWLPQFRFGFEAFSLRPFQSANGNARLLNTNQNANKSEAAETPQVRSSSTAHEKPTHKLPKTGELPEENKHPNAANLKTHSIKPRGFAPFNKRERPNGLLLFEQNDPRCLEVSGSKVGVVVALRQFVLNTADLEITEVKRVVSSVISKRLSRKTKDKIAKLYVGGLSSNLVAEEVGVARGSVMRVLRVRGIAVRGRSK